MKNLFLLFSFFLVISITSKAQNIPPGRSGSENGTQVAPGVVYGKVYDSESGLPVEYANIVLYSNRDSAMVYGAVTDARGNFMIEKVRYGQYYMEVKFIGYNRKMISDITINPQSTDIPLGKISIDPASSALQEFTVTSEVLPVEFHIDKKVVNVSQDLAATGMTAVQVLENVPSVQTDIDGNVSLRGSTSFTVLIDGRPSILQGTEALQQIAASSIDRIEIITNPSAKYDPDGVAGIINVILKKNKANGIAGVINLNAARGPEYGGDLLITYRTGKLNLISGFDYRQNENPGTNVFRRTSWSDDTTLYLFRDAERNRKHGGFGARLGAEYLLTPTDMFSVQGNVGLRDFVMSSVSRNLTYNDPSSFRDYSIRSTSSERNSLYGGGNLYYEHRFKGEKHKIEGSVRYTFSDVDSEEDYQEVITDSNYSHAIDGLRERSSDLGLRNDLEVKVDYTNNRDAKGTWEAGLQSRMENQNSDYIYQAYDFDLQEWESIPGRDNAMLVKTNIISAYLTYSNKWKKLGFKLGLRTEYDNRLIRQYDYNQEYLLDTFNLFPSVHMSYELNKSNQFLASYSRRINRPRSWDLNPYPFYVDNYTVRIGNPGLLPEFSNNFELSYLRRFKSSFVSVEAYHRITNQVINRIGYLVGDTLIYTSQNLDKDYSTGFELLGNIEIKKWWRIDISANIFRYQITGQIVESDVNQVTNTWSLRGSSTFILPTMTRIQVNGFYNAPSITAQGDRDGFYIVSAAVRQEFLKRKLGLTVQVRDIFNSRTHSFTTYGPGFEAYMKMDNLSPIYSVSLTYRINNYKKQDRTPSGNGSGGDMEDMMF